MPNVLVIDDDDSALLILSRYLTKGGFSVSTAMSGSEGVAAYVQGPVACVLIDYQMPDMDGLETCKAIRSEDADVPIFILSAHDTVDIEAECTAAGATGCISKIDDYTVLVERIRLAVTDRKTSRAL